jgi:hypothetical protein
MLLLALYCFRFLALLRGRYCFFVVLSLTRFGYPRRAFIQGISIIIQFSDAAD